MNSVRTLLSLSCAFILTTVSAQDYSPFTSQVNELVRACSSSDDATRQTQIDAAWNKLRSTNELPLVANDSVAFFYQGDARTVEWTGDFNQWNYDTTFPNKGKRIGFSNIWLLKAAFPRDARLDYKILINGTQWLLDPENKHQQWSGVGGGSVNSELRMPQWKPDDLLRANNSIARGTVSSDHIFFSKKLGYQISYDVYLPANHQPGEKLPVVYVTDGYEYRHQNMGNMVTVLDNLIGAKKIKPIAAVFIDHRDPVNRTNNRRMEELAMNAKYLSFFTDEFIPLVESNYPIAAGSANRAILGNSMGGLNSAYFVFSRPDVFSMAGIQSPAFYTRPQIYQLCEQSDGTPIKISMTSGTIYDTSAGSRKMKDVLESISCKYTYREVNEGHSWGNWRNLIDDILIDFFGI